MANTHKFQFLGIFFCLLICLGCNKEDTCNPMPSKRIVSEIYDTGFGYINKYNDNVISESKTSDGFIIDYDITSQQGSELLFQEWEYTSTGPNSGTRKLIGTYYLGFNPLNVPDENLPRANKYIREGGGTQTYEYNNAGNLIRSVLIFPPNFNIPPQVVIYTWQDGNMLSSVIDGVTVTYEYNTDKVNTLGNDFFGKAHLGVSSKNPIKREISHSSAGNLTTDYEYEYDEECYITKVTMITKDETDKVISTTWREFTYE